MTLEQDIVHYIETQKDVADHEIRRLIFAQGLVKEVLPHLPHTLSQYFTIYDVWTGYDRPPETSGYTLRLNTKLGLADEDIPQAFGTIVKVAGAFVRLGWDVQPQPEIEAADSGKALDVKVRASRFPTKLAIDFLHLPESERCRLVEESILEPEHYVTKLRVVCEGEPVKLVDEPAPPLEEPVGFPVEEPVVLAEGEVT